MAIVFPLPGFAPGLLVSVLLFCCCGCQVVIGTGWLRYESVSCGSAENRQLGNSSNTTLERCKSGTAANGFGQFASFDAINGLCVSYGRCDKPICHTQFTTYHALRGGVHPWQMGCAAAGPAPPHDPICVGGHFSSPCYYATHLHAIGKSSTSPHDRSLSACHWLTRGRIHGEFQFWSMHGLTRAGIRRRCRRRPQLGRNAA